MIERATEIAVQSRRVAREGGFLSLPGTLARVRERSAAGMASLRWPERLPPSEIGAAPMTVIRGGMGATSDQAVTGTSRMLGFTSTSTQLRHGIEAGIGQLRAQGGTIERHGMLVDAGQILMGRETGPTSLP